MKARNLGLMLLVGQTGQASLGHAAFLAIGCYANAILQTRLGLPFLISFPLAGVISGFAGVLLALPTTRWAHCRPKTPRLC